MWECIYKDFTGTQKRLLDGYEGKEKDLIRVALLLDGIACIDIFKIIFNILTSNTEFSKVNVISIVAVCVSFVLIAIAVIHSTKRESKQEYRTRELKKFKEILENKTYQLRKEKDKKEFLSYVEKEKEQLSSSFFSQNIKVTIISATIIFFTATMDTFSKFFNNINEFLLMWIIVFFQSLLLFGGITMLIGVKSPRLARCEQICSLTEEVILFANRLDNLAEERVHYTNYTDNLIAFVKKIMKARKSVH